ncbi:TonB-dependent receptor [Aliarcobacter thereius]|uniref:Ferric aerobactin receptor n=2 Tax=Aliarcobacter thereius TaxID=544718 RepID=A0A1C0B6U2_9BACT|nr:TonB-dependent receptor [Aliarcobacter thereius]OCL95979.1 Ferric aerobactin receptor precursor [Aliarcobacter thereius LMG 24486]OCL99308.1 Ferric aerobactin receptor precursor [Aliarcobacter thereius]QBF16049.1 TonB-dependent receptor [Aliarcobacter thereius LMG 24486]TLS71888.1 TonB-dependent receptor [Aliarcobacter thereius]TLS94609.1 TonB-dependent receptor [Aliarcobacter thereius]
MEKKRNLAKKIITLSFVTTAFLSANEITSLETINIVEKSNSKLIKDINSEELKSADLAEALMKNSANISIVRRNGIANDIILRGQKKDNINILIDGAKIYGACPNRMDPPTSHIATNNIKNVKIIEGPYDVENFGTLSGLVKVEMKEPKDGFHGEVNLNTGSFNYKKASATIEGGNEFVKALISASNEKGKAYKDGNGDNFLEQQKKRGVPLSNQYKDSDIDAFEKKTVFSKLQFNISDNQDLKLSYNANRSDGILYPAGPMDADYDDSDIYTLGYTIRELGSFSKELNLDYYYSKVDHPMSGKLRNGNGTSYMTNHLKTSVWGATVKNSLELSDSLITLGIDTSVRNWRGQMHSTNIVTGVITPNATMNRMYDTDTKNKAIFTKFEKSIGNLEIESGLRYDYTNIETQKPNANDKKYTGINGYLFTAYNFDEQSKVFAGIGKSSRVPDARELYMGNSNLDQTKNYEIDLGFEKTIGSFNIKPKIFYSELKNYIYNAQNGFENIDAKIYGVDLSAYYYFTDELSLDLGVSYLRGKKDGNYTDKDLAEISPLKTNLALNYEYKKAKFKAEVIAVDRWKKFDASAKEQEIAGYALVNLKYSQELFKNFELTLGVDNLFDKVYNSTNTYKDIRYVTVGGEQILFNDPGRYSYINLKYSF